jgi:hypothetical protein
MAAAPSSPRRPLAVRYSLRMLLLALTAFAIGFPIWYRRPYEEVEAEGTMGSRKGAPNFKRSATWQRQWGGGRLKHGPESHYMDGELLHRTIYRNGQPHGLWEQNHPSGAREVCQCENGKRHGLWQWIDAHGEAIETATWRDGLRHGKYRRWGYDGQWRELQFVRGRLCLGGKPVRNALTDLIDQPANSATKVVKELTSSTEFEFIETPLPVVTGFFEVAHGIPIRTDPLNVDRSQTVTAEARGLDLVSALSLLAADHKLTWAYRYGAIWLTSPADAEGWRDPTGVAEIVPPAGSPLADVWNEPVTLRVKRQPLTNVLQDLAKRLGIAVHVSTVGTSDRTNEPVLVRRDFFGHPFQQLLGMLLYEAGWRVKLDGETLVILPPAKNP